MFRAWGSGFMPHAADKYDVDANNILDNVHTVEGQTPARLQLHYGPILPSP